MSVDEPYATPMNILWVLCDELRADALGCYGNPEPQVETPHIDALASRGVLFEQAYTSSPVCVPARTAMLTGRKPGSTGVYGNEACAEGYPGEELGDTFTELFAQAGWATVNFGKEHVPRALSPWQVHDPSGSSMADIRDDVQKTGIEVVRAPGLGNILGGRLPEGSNFSSDVLTRNACRALRQLEEPFVLRASFLQPHTPVAVPEPWASMYDHVAFDSEEAVGPGAFEKQFARFGGGYDLEEQDLREARRLYHSSVRWLDDQIGLLMEELQDRGLESNTVVVLTSDHGANLGEDGSFGKHTFAHRSHQVPLIIAAPNKLSPGQRRGDLVTTEDLAPTLLSLCGQTVPEAMEGRDLFQEQSPSHITSVIGYGAEESRAFPNKSMGLYEDKGWPQRLCIRTSRFRFDLNTRVNGRPALPEEHDMVLIDRINDPQECFNLVDDPRYEEVKESLLALALSEAEALVVPDDGAVYSSFVPPAATREIEG